MAQTFKYSLVEAESDMQELQLCKAGFSQFISYEGTWSYDCFNFLDLKAHYLVILKGAENSFLPIIIKSTFKNQHFK